ncbi:catechol 2,3-dioxygenase-like lactoylglutathione lyase family enzyme [Alkalihalobacillus xiaoxiensis]|uniref:Catechol 2,3-dioxygenase-like lactoylglutathione lyase family enzyme n=1 Tax=Shouchella xiaoxiensis TaxID=766895 RepID=A0ABS2SQX6_9BACI|nr:catechol 2,3-dioxygenase-like lactoylglutathione lyase family enzyme [Shouchella xiaoxiensis]
MLIKGIHHVQLTIPTGMEEEAITFYCGVLGLSQVEKPDSLKDRGGFWLSLGNQDVHVGTETDVDRLKTKAHIAYEVEGIAYWRERLKEKGFSILEGIPIPGFDRFEFRDPFGNRVELIEAIV